MSLAGLISGVMGGAARGYTDVAQSEVKKQQELDLRKEMLAAEEEKQLRIDEITRQRNRGEEDRKLTPEYLEKVGTADRMKGEMAARNRRDIAPLTAEADAAELKAGASNVTRKAQLEGEAKAAQVNAPGYTAALRKETDAKESSSAKASAAAATSKDRREQADFDRLVAARKVTGEYQDAIDRGDQAAAKAARKKGMELGVDPASVKRGELKVTEDDMGRKVLVHEDQYGNVTRVDTQGLDPYTPRSGSTQMPAPKSPEDLKKLPSGTRYKAPDGSIRIKQ